MLKEIGTKVIETNRLILRKFTIDDVENVYNNWTSDVKANEFLSWNIHENKEVTLEEVKKILKEYEDPYVFNWVVELKETKEIIGNIKTAKIKVNGDICEIGFCYGSKFWGNGYGAEALKEVLKFLIKEVGFRLVEGWCTSDNPASEKVMINAGMQKEAVLRKRKINKVTKMISDYIIYSITREEL